MVTRVDALSALVATDGRDCSRVTVSFTDGEAAVTVVNTGTILVDTSPEDGP